ncbi:uncharacterized protein BDZ99DRAFT_513533 [Mytilinidion resinicola]|uniref:Uncharacterized protein n=1 Tax=Mytilinidion resinicola TaxID=574789 RepID=A0A6A6Z846_9PEZI|nr:uncharacterized protein BDZ99DRAFT_513533 [Mytilinidion resinicola]KAF2817291.1 hypothetical protein BDZ99DRAFT_513533 [Mytilinidion resinicola]
MAARLKTPHRTTTRQPRENLPSSSHGAERGGGSTAWAGWRWDTLKQLSHQRNQPYVSEHQCGWTNTCPPSLCITNPDVSQSHRESRQPLCHAALRVVGNDPLFLLLPLPTCTSDALGRPTELALTSLLRQLGTLEDRGSCFTVLSGYLGTWRSGVVLPPQVPPVT